MSIAADIKREREIFEDHVARHKCRPAASGERCEQRVELWEQYIGTAALWGQEPDDEQRQRDHFNRNVRPAAA